MDQQVHVRLLIVIHVRRYRSWRLLALISYIRKKAKGGVHK